MEENKTPAKPVMDVAPPKPPEVHPDPSEEKPDKPAKTDKPAPKPKRPAPPKKSADNSGVGMAIAATVVIVLGLAAMATYAYLKTQ
jgi:uncharacterized protein HemX